MQPPPSAPAPLLVPSALLTGLEAKLPLPALALSTPDTALRYTRRTLKDASVFLLFNESAVALNNVLTLHVAGKTVERWDPQTGNVHAIAQADVEPHAAAIRLPLNLGPYEAEVLVVH